MVMTKKYALLIILTFFFLISLFIPGQLLTAGELTGLEKNPSEASLKTPAVKENSGNKFEEIQKGDGPDKISSEKKKKAAISLSAGTGILRGHTTYQIGGSYDSPKGSGEMHFPLSELIFPLNTYMALFETNLLFFEKMKIDLNFQTNLKNNTDNMKDSDWGIPYEDPPNSEIYYWYGPGHLDIYSESKTDLRLYILDVDLLYRFFQYIPSSPLFKDINFFIGPGYVYQQYKFQCRLIRQWDYRPDNPKPKDAVGDGNIGLTYNITTHIPSVKLNTEISLKKILQINVSIAYSPYTIVEDRDNHILRSKISKAECTGNAFLFSLSGKIDLTKSLFINLQFDYVSIDTEGKQKQYTFDVWTATIDQKNFSERKSAELSIGYTF